ncbi:helix-turn-helix domain-containing protein [Lactobacillus kefiranofaciens]|uniref:helix-turn-helix domain-containing protein n=1 Tax=Lactobacillus kefiranofaciens TaxID=267818 RepID=UPI0021C3CCA5|nr:helix-turn-helix transcriptional regulator [Lactobacillus kefiranofaciens]
MTIGEALKSLRQSLGLTQAQMIKGSKITITHYSKMKKGQNRIFVDDLILILQLRGVSIANFFKKYFPTKYDMISQEISQELNQAFYNNDVKKARNLKRQILVDKHISTELKDRADLIINILNSGDDTASIK